MKKSASLAYFRDLYSGKWNFDIRDSLLVVIRYFFSSWTARARDLLLPVLRISRKSVSGSSRLVELIEITSPFRFSQPGSPLHEKQRALWILNSNILIGLLQIKKSWTKVKISADCWRKSIKQLWPTMLKKMEDHYSTVRKKRWRLVHLRIMLCAWKL